MTNEKERPGQLVELEIEGDEGHVNVAVAGTEHEITKEETVDYLTRLMEADEAQKG